MIGMNIIVTLILEPGDGSCIFCKLIILANHRLLLMIDEHIVKTHTKTIKKSMWYMQTKKSNSTGLTKTNPLFL